jgi:hypothetical protein
LNASIPCNGSVAGIPSNAADGLTTRRAWTLGVDFAADRPISPKTVALLAAGPPLRPRHRQVRDQSSARGLSHE